jgi:hypothetical protein
MYVRFFYYSGKTKREEFFIVSPDLDDNEDKQTNKQTNKQTTAALV